MPRLYSGFAGRTPGAGLLLLRTAIGVTLVAHAVMSVSDARDANVITFVFCLLALASGASLIIGFLTRLAAAVAAVLAVSITRLSLVAPAINSPHSHRLDLNLIIIAVAVALLGPGAFSLDAVLFGRRRIVIPRSPLSSQP